MNAKSDDGTVSQWIEQLKTGDSLAARQIWEHYFERLTRAARLRLKGQNRAVSDEEDVVLSVFESFYDAAQQGRFPELSDRDALWRLLLKMAARKIIDKRRRDLRQRRGGRQQIHSLAERSREEYQELEVIGNEPSPEMVAMTTEAIERLMAHLGDGQLRDIALAKLEGYSNAELALQHDCSERTVERRLHLIREKCRQELLEIDA